MFLGCSVLGSMFQVRQFNGIYKLKSQYCNKMLLQNPNGYSGYRITKMVSRISENVDSIPTMNVTWYTYTTDFCKRDQNYLALFLFPSYTWLKQHMKLIVKNLDSLSIYKLTLPFWLGSCFSQKEREREREGGGRGRVNSRGNETLGRG